MSPTTTNVHGAGTTIRSTKKSDVIATILRKEIVEGLLEKAISEGDALSSEHELLQRFGVSRPTLREAMRLLETDCLVEMHVGANGGARVRRPPPETASRQVALQFSMEDCKLDELFALLAAQHGESARLAAERATPEEIESLVAIADSLAECLSDPLAAQDVYGRFEDRVVEVSHSSANMVMHRVMNAVSQHRSRQFAITWLSRSETTELNMRSQKSLYRLINLIRDRNAVEAMMHWRNHAEVANSLYFDLVDPKTSINLDGYW